MWHRCGTGLVSGTPLATCAGMTLPRLRPFPMTAMVVSDASQDTARRVLNVLIALVGLLIALLPMLIIAVLIKLTSRGPVLFIQQRVGLNRRAPEHTGGNFRRHADHGGLTFTMYKFRTMRMQDPAAPAPAQIWATPDDPRITSIGRFLRKLRLDELPQLWNVLMGDMNIVGPRPEQLAIFASLRDQITEYPRRQQVLPGITGWAQINQAYDSSVEDVRQKLNYDLEYIGRRSALEDLKIMLLTPAVMLGRRYGW
jgi:lipopolysaccharide/colanic/teichoic acid biosynthesis glycosyltransferase